MIHNKLVRDKIPEIIHSKWETAKTRILKDNEYIEELRKKLKEEVEELLDSWIDDPEELIDILEVVYSIWEYHWVLKERLEELRREKLEKRWWFADRIYLEETK